MKKTIWFDPETDDYEEVLAEVKLAYGFRTWSQSDVDLWVSLLNEEQTKFLALLAESPRGCIPADEAKRRLGYEVGEKRCLARLTHGFTSSAQKGPGHPPPVEFVQSSRMYSLEPLVAKLVRKTLFQHD